MIVLESPPSTAIQPAVPSTPQHLALPFRFAGGRAVTHEQDTVDEVATCAEVVLRCPIGHRLELEEFGYPAVDFVQAPVPVETLKAAIARWEPRASATLTESGDASDEAIRRVRIDLQAEVS